MEEQHDDEIEDMLGILQKALLPGYESFEIPSLSGMNSLIGSPISNLELTNVFNVPLIPDPTSNYNVIYIKGCSSHQHLGHLEKVQKR